MIEVDRIMIEELGISLAQMMENAGRNLARLCLDLYRPSRVDVLAGSGGNGGGGMVAARHLSNAGVSVRVMTTRPPRDLSGIPRQQMNTLAAMGLPTSSAEYPKEPGEVIIDALVGYSLSGGLRGRAADLVRWTAEIERPVLALDVPSGLDVDGDVPDGPVVAADVTMTLALPKVSLIGSALVGDLFLADISVPPSLYRRFDLDVASDLFATASVIRV